MSFDERLDALEQRLTEIEREWSRPEVAADPDAQRDLGREQAQIEPVVDVYRQLKTARADLSAAHEAEGDPELRELARAEIETAERQAEELMREAPTAAPAA